MAINERLASDLIVHPGEELADTIAALSLSQKDLADRTGISRKHINRIIKGKELISAKVALLFEKVLGTPANFWVTLSQNYELDLSKALEAQSYESQAQEIRRFPIKDMIRYKFMPESNTNSGQVKELLTFFGAPSFKILNSVLMPSYKAAYRKADGKEASPEALAVWLQAGKNMAKASSVEEFDADRLRALIPELRRKTRTLSTFIENARKLLSSAGVTLVMVPHPKGTYANGATFWLAPRRPVVQLSIRFRWCDIIIFTLFHEIGHILRNHPHTRIYVENGKVRDRLEVEADRFASEALIPAKSFNPFFAAGDFSTKTIIREANRLEIHPSIIAGRIQRLNNDWANPRLSAHREQFMWSVK